MESVGTHALYGYPWNPWVRMESTHGRTGYPWIPWIPMGSIWHFPGNFRLYRFSTVSLARTWCADPGGKACHCPDTNDVCAQISDPLPNGIGIRTMALPNAGVSTPFPGKGSLPTTSTKLRVQDIGTPYRPRRCGENQPGKGFWVAPNCCTNGSPVDLSIDLFRI
jgi:hypothetical protein